jgi:hypothetical protein
MPVNRSLTKEQRQTFLNISDKIANQANFLFGMGVFTAGYDERSYAHPVFYVELKESQVGNPNLDMDEVERIGDIALNNVLEQYMPEIIEVQMQRKVRHG